MLEHVFTKEAPEAESILGTVDTFLRWRNLNSPPREFKMYHPSAFGSCLRKMQYQLYASLGIVKADHEDQLETRIMRLFEKGHNMQSRWERYFTAMGIIRGVWACSNPLCNNFDDNGVFDSTRKEKMTFPHKTRHYGEDQLCGVFRPDKCLCGSNEFEYCEVLVKSDDLNMVGHADIILDFSKFDPKNMDGIVRTYNINNLPKKPIVVDMKTINQKGFDELVQINKPPKIDYIIQLMIYSFILDCEYGVLIYECKNDSSVVSFKINKNEETWKLIQDQARKMKEMAEAKDENGSNLYYLPPPRPCKKSDYECAGYKGKGLCPFKKSCQKSNGIWDHPELEERRINFYGNLLKDK